MKEWLLLIIATAVAATYNMTLMITLMESAKDKFETAAHILILFNTLKDILVLTAILTNIYL